MTPSEFRAELINIMPGYKWVVRRSSSKKYLLATGTQSSGSNRLSTLQVERRDNLDGSSRQRYEVMSAGYGRRAPWLHATSGATLAQALRNLQNHYERKAATYSCHATDLANGRKRQQQEQPHE